MAERSQNMDLFCKSSSFWSRKSSIITEFFLLGSRVSSPFPGWSGECRFSRDTIPGSSCAKSLELGMFQYLSSKIQQGSKTLFSPLTPSDSELFFLSEKAGFPEFRQHPFIIESSAPFPTFLYWSKLLAESAILTHHRPNVPVINCGTGYREILVGWPVRVTFSINKDRYFVVATY